MIYIYDPFFASQEIPSTIILDVESYIGNFVNGEIVTQSASGARGLVLSSNASHLTLQRLSFSHENTFVATSNTLTFVAGETTGALGMIRGALYDHATHLGADASASSRFVETQGGVLQVEIFKSGFGFVQNEEVIMSKGTNHAFGYANLHGHGISEGFYKDNPGTKKLFDGIYYQPFSYEVRSSVINKHKSELANITHVAGTKYFNKLVYDSDLSVIPSISTEKTIIVHD